MKTPIYIDYHSGDGFDISLIPIENTTYSSLDELEAYATGAYHASAEYGGYNRTNGNIILKVNFKNDELEKVASLILNRIKGTITFQPLQIMTREGNTPGPLR